MRTEARLALMPTACIEWSRSEPRGLPMTLKWVADQIWRRAPGPVWRNGPCSAMNLTNPPSGSMRPITRPSTFLEWSILFMPTVVMWPLS